MKSAREVELRTVLRYLEKQVEHVRRLLVPFEPAQQAELVPAPPRPPRAKSQGEEDYAEYVATRRTRLEELGVGELPDEEPPPIPFVNSAMKKIRAACKDDRQLEQAFDLFFALDYPARMDPPYPFNAFVKKFPELIEQLNRTPAPSGAPR